jgi:peptide chain release factor 3
MRGLPVSFGPSRVEVCLDACPSSVAADLDGAPVFMASSAFNLRYEQERWPKIAFTDVKDYQKAAA